VSEEILKREPDNLEALLVLAGANVVLNRIRGSQRAIQKLLGTKPAYTVAEFARFRPYQDKQKMDAMVTRLQQAGLP
jgi:cytochrome c-type biogenesis protein CcmH/NrfG